MKMSSLHEDLKLSRALPDCESKISSRISLKIRLVENQAQGTSFLGVLRKPVDTEDSNSGPSHWVRRTYHGLKCRIVLLDIQHSVVGISSHLPYFRLPISTSLGALLTPAGYNFT